MAKGVKTIKPARQYFYPRMSAPGKSYTIEADKTAPFSIEEWTPETTDDDKKHNITWLVQTPDRKHIITSKTIPGTNPFPFKIPANLCGSYYYYIEASLNGKRDLKNKTGVYVKGYCKPCIVSSKWALNKNGAPLNNKEKNNRGVCYGETIHLHAETEGLNGDVVTVEIYNEKVLRHTERAKVIDGAFHLEIKDTKHWWFTALKKASLNDEYYFKLKDKYGNYVSNKERNWLDHGLYLNIKNQFKPTFPTPPTNQTATKVGEPNKSKINYHLCRFDQINVEDNGQTFTVFDNGSTKLKKVTPQPQYGKYSVHFDFDKADIRTDAQLILKSLLDFLKYNKHLDIVLSGHADDRGTIDYNQKLSEKRAHTIRDFLIKGDLNQNRIKAKGYGELNPAAAGKTEEVYKKNRRVEIDFSYIEYNEDALIYETVAGGRNNPKNITIDIINRSDKACFRKDKHKKNEVIVNQIEIKQGNSIKYPVNSELADFPNNYAYLLLKFLNPFAKIYNQFNFHINSCAYYADKTKATVQVKAYPDVVWIGHFQYNYGNSGTYFFHNKSFDLEIGIGDVVKELRDTIFYKLYTILTSSFITDEVIMNYIVTQSDSFSYGIHTIHNRSIEKTGQALSLVGTQTNLLTQTKYTKYFAAAVIYGFVVAGIIIDLIIIYLTRGRSLEGKILKISNKVKKAQQVLKLMEDAGLELIPPAIAINAGMYYQKQPDNRLALVYEANLKANPLIALNFKKEFDLFELITKTINGIKKAKHPNDKKALEKLERYKENNEKIKAHLKSKGLSVRGNIDVTGSIFFEKKIQYNFLTNTYSFTDKIGNLIQMAENEYLITNQVQFKAEIEIKYNKQFKFATFQNAIHARLEVSLQGVAGLKLKYGVNTKGGKGLFVEKTLYCSGIEGTYLGSLKGRNKYGNFLDWESNNGKPTPFTLIEPFEVPLLKIQLFKS